jgi:DNA invertase Pin-like site-specific DNA recombinase
MYENPSEIGLKKVRKIGTFSGRDIESRGGVPCKGQTTENQRLALEQWAANAGCTVVATFEDKVSGAKGRDKRPQFDALLKAAVRREFDMITVWSSDRLGRSMSHLIAVIETIKGTGVGLYVHTQALDTTTPAGRAMFQMLGVFGEFEREMIRERVNSGLDRVRGEIDRKGVYETKNGHTSKCLGRPGAELHKIEEARKLLAAGHGSTATATAASGATSVVARW